VVRALQGLTGGPAIESAWAPVDATTGAFTMSLPIQPPVRAAYVPNPAALVFSTDAGATGKYTVEARSAGVVKTVPVDVTASVPPLNFSFP
jgi:hypothetical protein